MAIEAAHARSIAEERVAIETAAAAIEAEEWVPFVARQPADIVERRVQFGLPPGQPANVPAIVPAAIIPLSLVPVPVPLPSVILLVASSTCLGT